MSSERRLSCLHFEKRIIKRVSKKIPMDKRPDLVLRICHFPLASLSGIQCPVASRGDTCPHEGPYGRN